MDTWSGWLTLVALTVPLDLTTLGLTDTNYYLKKYCSGITDTRLYKLKFTFTNI